jgi:RNA polymerase sigma factor (sigma-70 family)
VRRLSTETETASIVADDDEDLAARAQAGGTAGADAFDALYRRHVTAVYRYQLAWCGDSQTAQDAVAQTFVAALQSVRRFDTSASFKAWLFGIAHNKALDARRSRARSAKRIAPLDDADLFAEHAMPLDEHVARKLDIAQIKYALALLNADRAQALTLRYFAALDTDEIAAAMRKSEANIRQLLSRGLRELRAALASGDES